MQLNDNVNSSLLGTVTDSSLQLPETSAPRALILSSGFCGDYTQTYTYKHKFKKLKKTPFSKSFFIYLELCPLGVRCGFSMGAQRGLGAGNIALHCILMWAQRRHMALWWLMRMLLGLD